MNRDYNLHIFDCDGVILDSNLLKIDAMKQSLEQIGFDDEKVSFCINYFKNNFGKSRFHHIEHFAENILDINDKEGFKRNAISLYSDKCKELYLNSDLTPGFIEYIEKLEGLKFVASGSEQEELRSVFHQKGIDKYFNAIYGSPSKKANIVANLITSQNVKKAVMYGDSVSDFESATENGVDFVYYSPFSNVNEKMQILKRKYHFVEIKMWAELNK